MGGRSLLVVDEIDELGISRDSEDGDVYELLRLLDGVDSSRNLTVIATTNRIGDLDEALLRPGRFYPVLGVEPPDRRQKMAIVEHYGERYQVSLDAGAVLDAVQGCFTGADIRAAVEDCLIEGNKITTENVIGNLREIQASKQELGKTPQSHLC